MWFLYIFKTIRHQTFIFIFRFHLCPRCYYCYFFFKRRKSISSLDISAKKSTCVDTKTYTEQQVEKHKIIKYIHIENASLTLEKVNKNNDKHNDIMYLYIYIILYKSTFNVYGTTDNNIIVRCDTPPLRL